MFQTSSVLLRILSTELVQPPNLPISRTKFSGWARRAIAMRSSSDWKLISVPVLLPKFKISPRRKYLGYLLGILLSIRIRGKCALVSSDMTHHRKHLSVLLSPMQRGKSWPSLTTFHNIFWLDSILQPIDSLHGSALSFFVRSFNSWSCTDTWASRAGTFGETNLGIRPTLGALVLVSKGLKSSRRGNRECNVYYVV